MRGSCSPASRSRSRLDPSRVRSTTAPRWSSTIRWEHVDLENCRLLLPGTKTKKSRRWIPIAAPLLALLRDIPPELRVGPIAEKWERPS